jgi:type II secretory pathway predicted ATPase ExeA
MRYQYVKTSAYLKFVDAIKMLAGAAKEARILLLTGEPATGKSRCVDYWGSANQALHIEGFPTMSVSYVRDFLAYELGCQGGSKFVQQKAIQDDLTLRQLPIILDEAQHGLDKKAEVIEYLRRVAEQAGCKMVLICHNSERHRFAEHRMAHLSTRISELVEFKPADRDDCALYINSLCEVSVDDGVIDLVHQQSRGRYRLMISAISTLEDIANQHKTTLNPNGDKSVLLTAAFIKKLGFADTLCVDAMKELNAKAKKSKDVNGV